MIDVLVVGAGPAGSVCALLLARAGARVQLVDRAAFPRDKLCGDTLNPGAMAILDRIGGPDCPPDAPGLPHRGSTLGDLVRANGAPITGMTVTGPGAAAVSAEYPGGVRGVALTRRDLDLTLVEAAVAAGAAFEPGVRVEAPLVADARVLGVRAGGAGARAGGRALRARLVIAADGRASRLGAALGLSALAPAPRRWAFGAYYHGVAGLTSRGEMHVRRGGYLGIAPLPGGLANVCVVREARRGAHAPRVVVDRIIDQAIDAEAGLRDRFADARRASPVSVLGPLAVSARASGCPGLLLAGDAAGFVDPMTGDGLRFALRGAELAAAAALRELADGCPGHHALHAARRHAFDGKWRINRALRALVGSPHAVSLAARLTRHWALPVEYLIGVAGDVALATASAGHGHDNHEDHDAHEDLSGPS